MFHDVPSALTRFNLSIAKAASRVYENIHVCEFCNHFVVD